MTDHLPERDRLMRELVRWRTEALAWRNGCTGKRGSQAACVDAQKFGEPSPGREAMRLYRVKVRRYYPPQGKKAIGRGAWNDEEVLLEAEDIGHARTEGFDVLLASKHFGANPEHCEVVEAARVTLPYHL